MFLNKHTNINEQWQHNSQSHQEFTDDLIKYRVYRMIMQNMIIVIFEQTGDIYLFFLIEYNLLSN